MSGSWSNNEKTLKRVQGDGLPPRRWEALRPKKKKLSFFKK
jgi:hypothetical protein